MMIDHRRSDRVRDLGVGQLADPQCSLRGRDAALTNLVEEAEQLRTVHERFYLTSCDA
jgi:hypothetical protein